MSASKLEYLSKEDCAARLGKSARTLDNWAKDPAFPKAARKGLRGWCAEVIQEWLRRKSASDDGQTVTAAAKGKGEVWEALKLEFMEGKARSQTAKSVLDVAEAGKELGLLLPRVAFESVLSTLFGGIRDLCESMPDRVTQIEGLDDLQRERVRDWIKTILEPWQNKTADRISGVLADLGPVPDLLDLAEMSANSETSGEDTDS